MIRILTATVAAMLATSASADQSSVIIVDGAPTARVSYADLNLQSNAGRLRMTHRIRSAAERMCVNPFYRVSITEPERNDCYRVALADGMTQLEAIARR